MDEEKLNPLQQAIEAGDEALIHTLLAQSTLAEIVCASPKLKVTALHLAAYHGDLATATQLLSRGADPCAVNVEGDSPLHLAAHGGYLTLLTRLLDAVCASASVPGGTAAVAATATSAAGAVATASPSDRLRMQHDFLRLHVSGDGMTCLLYAVEQGHEDIFDWICGLFQDTAAVAASSDPATTDSGGSATSTALPSPSPPLAAWTALLNQGNHSGVAALHFAISVGSPSMFHKILAGGAQIDAITEDGFCPLLLSVQVLIARARVCV
jgi:ankyrin repeat protein